MNFSSLISDVTFTHWHGFCGLGAAAKGFNKGTARVGNLRAKFRCIGGVDNNPAAIRDFSRLAGVPGTLLDMFDREQYCAFHGREPPPDWRAAMPADIRRSAHGEFPDIVFLSAPCKGFSGLLPEQSSKTAKYQALNRLTLRGIWLMLEAFSDNLPKLIIFENVPRIQTRGRALLDQIVALLRSYGYAVAETTHDCGEIGGLGQSRKRFLLVARHEATVPPFLYEPEKRRLRGVGEILETLPLPGDPRGGPLHRMPALQWKTWVRLAFVEAGSDWRSLNKLAIEDGMLRDFGILPDVAWRDHTLGVVPWDRPAGVITGSAEATTGRFSIADPRAFGEPHNTAFGVNRWQDAGGTVTANGRPAAGAFSVADPRPPVGSLEYSQYGVRPWGEPSGAVINVKSPGQGVFSVSDPRIAGKPRFNNVYRIVKWDEASPAVAGPGGTAGGLAVADPRPAPRDDYKQTKYRVTAMDEPAGTVIAASTTGNGAFAVADPRPCNELRSGVHGVRKWDEPSGTVAGESLPPNGAFSVADPRPVGLNANRDHYKTGGHYGVLPWDDHAGAVPAFGKYDRGPWSVADPREAEGTETETLPAAADRLVAVIRALDGTWHRPFTTLELAALQSLVDPDDIVNGFTLDGESDSAWRERIGNAVPPDAATAVAGVMGTTLLLAMTGHTFTLSSQPIWVQPIALALAIDQRGNVPIEGRFEG
jgi:site-specific DNA-cytosine methylase